MLKLRLFKMITHYVCQKKYTYVTLKEQTALEVQIFDHHCLDFKQMITEKLMSIRALSFIFSQREVYVVSCPV